MRGVVLEFDRLTQLGLISGDDGRRYRFVGSQVQREDRVQPGECVDFEAHGDSARQIYRLTASFSPESRILARRESSGHGPAQEASSVGGPVAWSRADEEAVELAWRQEQGLWEWYVQAISLQLPIEGRGRRREYWGFCFFNFIVMLPLALFAIVVAERTNLYAAWIPFGIYVLVASVAGVIVYVRRLHDIGLTGWFIVFAAIPIFVFVTCVIPSQAHDNRWGPPAAPW